MDIQELVKMLSEEKCSVAQLQAYDISYFTEWDNKIKTIGSEDLIEAKQVCDDFFEEHKNSVIARYVSGMITLFTRPQEDNIAFLDLISSFTQVNQWELVEYLCQKILGVKESKPALRLLASCYEALGKEKEKYEVWERIIKVDYSETDILRQLADYKFSLSETSNADKELAITYYKKLLNRLMTKNDAGQIKECFPILVSLISDDFGYLVGVCERVATHVGNAYAVALLNVLADNFNDNIDELITINKKILEYSQDNLAARNSLVQCFKIKYKDHGRLETCLTHSKIADKNFKLVLHAIEDFETNIAFDKGTFVFQKSTGRIGRISSISDDEVLIDFAGQGKKSEGSSMSTDMAFKSLDALPKSHIWVLKSAVPHNKLKAKVQKDIAWALRILMGSHNNQSSIKEMKAELVPSLLSAREWTAWNNAAKKELMSNPLFGVSVSETDTFTLRSTPITFEEKQLNIFKSEKLFYDKIKCIREFILNKGDVESDSFLEMVEYFAANITNKDGTPKSISYVSDTLVSSYLILEDLYENYKMNFIKLPEGMPFESIYEHIDDKVECFRAIKDPEIKKLFIDRIVDCDDIWEKTLLDLYPYYLTSYIPDTFRSNKKAESFSKIFKRSISKYKDENNVFLYLYKTYDVPVWEKNGVLADQLIFTGLLLLDYTLKCIENKKAVTENRKNVKILIEKLFTNKTIYNYIKSGDENTAKKIWSLVADLPLSHGDTGKKIEVRHQINELYPNFNFDDQVDKNADNFIPTGLFCLQSSLDAKKDELYNLQTVLLPEVTKEIGEARELGDLKENSEYIYGKERQRMLNSQLVNLNDEIERSSVVRPEDVDDSEIGFGTRVTLFDNKKKAEVVYTIMGVWEADPSKNIINMLAPLGYNLLKRKVGEEVKFKVNDLQFDFNILKIEKAI